MRFSTPLGPAFVSSFLIEENHPPSVLWWISKKEHFKSIQDKMYLRQIAFAILTIAICWVACSPLPKSNQDDEDMYTVDLRDLFDKDYDYYNDKKEVSAIKLFLNLLLFPPCLF